MPGSVQRPDDIDMGKIEPDLKAMLMHQVIAGMLN